MSSSQRGRGSVILRAVRRPALRRVLVAYLIFQIAEWANWIALLVWAFGEGGVRESSLIALAQLVPGALLAPWVARLLERLPRARALTLGYVFQALALCVTGVVLLSDAPTAFVFVAAAFAGVSITCTRPVHNTLLPVISETAEDLTVGNAATGTLDGVAVLVGPLLSGILTVAWGPGGVLLTTGIATAFGAVVTFGLREKAGTTSPYVSANEGRTTTLGVLRDPSARLLTVLMAAEYALVGMSDILLVVLALDVLGMSESGPGLLNSALGMGALIGAAATVVLIGRKRLAPALLAAAVVTGVPFAFAGLATVPLTAILLVAVAGAGKVFFDVCSRTLVQRALPDRMLTAVFGLQETTMMTGLALGVILAPLVVHIGTPAIAFLVAGLLLPVVAVVSWPALKSVDRAASVPEGAVLLLVNVPFLAVLTPLVIERLAQGLDRLKFVSGAPVITEGSAGDDFYVIESGTAEVSLRGGPIRTLGPGQWFGELALLNDSPRTATVVSREDLVLGRLRRGPFLSALTGAPLALGAAGGHAQTYES